MDVPSSWICGHCWTEQTFDGPQRCVSCGLNMLSDAEQMNRHNWASAAQALAVWQQGGKDARHLAQMQRHFALLAPLEALQPAWQPWLEAMRTELGLLEGRQAQFQRQWWLHLAIAVVLLAAPVLLALLRAPGSLVFLTALPVAGWCWLGLFEFYKRNKP